MLIVALSSVSMAGSNSRSGTSGAQELLLPVGARMIGLFGSDIAGVKGIEAMYWNPAGVSLLSGNAEVMFFNGDVIGDISQKYVAGGFNFGDVGVFSFSLKNVDFGDIAVTTVDEPSGTGEMYSPSFIIATAGYSNSLTDRIRVGVNVNVISEKIVRTSANGVSFDAGIQYSNLGNVNGLSFGVVIKNLGPNMKFDGPDLLRYAQETTGDRDVNFYKIDSAPFELPSLFEIGLSYQFSIDDINQLNFGGLFQNNNYSLDSYIGSVEYEFNNMVFVRGGYTVSPNADSDRSIFGLSYGAGINYDLGFTKIKIDYAYRDSKYFDGLNQFGVTLGL